MKLTRNGARPLRVDVRNLQLSDFVSTPLQYRNGLDNRLEAAAQIVLGVLEDLPNLSSKDSADELARRRLRATTASIIALVAELQHELQARAKARRHDECPHCLWASPATSSGRCARCGKVRNASERGGRRSACDVEGTKPNPALPRSGRTLAMVVDNTRARTHRQGAASTRRARARRPGK